MILQHQPLPPPNLPLLFSITICRGLAYMSCVWRFTLCLHGACTFCAFQARCAQVIVTTLIPSCFCFSEIYPSVVISSIPSTSRFQVATDQFTNSFQGEVEGVEG